MDLVDFLKARLDEDEQVARVAAVDSGGTWQAGPGVWGHLDDVFPVVYDEGRPTSDQAAHIARHDPARVLADIAAKRAFIEWCQDDPPCHDGGWAYMDRALAALAQPYADHPDYREEWS